MITDENAANRSLPRRLEQLQTDIAAVRSEATDLEQQARTLIRQRPVVSVMVAAGVGFLAARIVARAAR